MLRLLSLLIGSFRRLFSSRRDLLLENLALHQQLMTFKRRDCRPKIGKLDKVFWVLTRRLWLKWKQALVIVTSETVVRVAPGRLPVLLELSVPPSKHVRPQADQQRVARADFPHGS